MAIKTVNIKKYICSDGKEFVGGYQRSSALSHEKRLKSMEMTFDFEYRIAEILGASQFLMAVENFDEEKTFNHEYVSKAEAFNDAYYDEDMGDSISELFRDHICPSDLGSFTDAAEMIVMIIDQMGGIQAIKALYKFWEENG